jgi:large subunit ribosomal protein L9
MDVILLERIEKLGQMGDVVTVKPGYARNFLLPQKKALRATDESQLAFKEQRAQLEATNLEQRKEAEAVAAKMEGLNVALIRQAGEAGQLYGSVNARDIAAAVTEAGTTVLKTQVALNRPIKSLGLFDVRISLHPEVSAEVRLNVARTQEEAEIQAKTGTALISGDAQHDEEEAAAARALEQAEEMFETPPPVEELAEGASEEAEPEKDAEPKSAGSESEGDDESKDEDKKADG